MRKKLWMSVLGVALTGLMLTQAAMAEFVYVTKSGKKYHTAQSRFIKNKKGIEKLTVEEAESRGYTPGKDYVKSKSGLKKAGKKSSSKKSGKKR